MITAVLFDLFDTLINSQDPSTPINPEKMAIEKLNLDFTQKEVDFVFCGTVFENEEITSKKIAEKLGIKDANEIIRIYNTQKEIMAPVAGAKEALEALKKEGFKIGLVSDNPFFDTREILKRFGFLEHFDAITLSNELGILKPDERIYIKTFQALKASASEAVMVGDSYLRDIEPVLKLGGKGIYFDWKERGLPKGVEVPVVKEFTEIIKKVKEIKQAKA